MGACCIPIVRRHSSYSFLKPLTALAGGKLHGLVTGFEMVWGKGFRTPKEVRASLPAGKQVVAFQNRNPVHKAHFELLAPRCC